MAGSNFHSKPLLGKNCINNIVLAGQDCCGSEGSYLCVLHRPHSIRHRETRSSHSSTVCHPSWCIAALPELFHIQNKRSASCANAGPLPLCIHQQKWSVENVQCWIYNINNFSTGFSKGQKWQIWILLHAIFFLFTHAVSLPHHMRSSEVWVTQHGVFHSGSFLHGKSKSNLPAVLCT